MGVLLGLILIGGCSEAVGPNKMLPGSTLNLACVDEDEVFRAEIVKFADREFVNEPLYDFFVILFAAHLKLLISDKKKRFLLETSLLQIRCDYKGRCDVLKWPLCLDMNGIVCFILNIAIIEIRLFCCTGAEYYYNRSLIYYDSHEQRR
jgi:hypothetical protein